MVRMVGKVERIELSGGSAPSGGTVFIVQGVDNLLMLDMQKVVKTSEELKRYARVINPTNFNVLSPSS